MNDKDTDRIRDIPKVAELRRNFRLLQAASPFLRLFGRFNERIAKSLESAVAAQEELAELVETLEKFNDHFALLGWIAYDSMKTSVMREAVLLAELDRLEEGEQLLADFYDEKTVRARLTMMRFIDEFRPRERLLLLALEDYAAGRYHACIPVVLANIDGLTHDILHRSFFAQETDLSIFDSVVGHRTGLPELARVLSRANNVTRVERVTIPYRNRILHGRELNYDNKIAAAKAWAALFALRDWIVAYRKPESELKSQPSWQEALAHYAETQKEIERLEQWSPRDITVGTNIPPTGKPSDYGDSTPERALVTFLELWRQKNYGHMGKMLFSAYQQETSKKTAGWVREVFGEIGIEGYSILNVVDKNAFMTDCQLELTIRTDRSSFSTDCQIRLVRERGDGLADYVSRENPAGEWRVVLTQLNQCLRKAIKEHQNNE